MQVRDYFYSRDLAVLSDFWTSLNEVFSALILEASEQPWLKKTTSNETVCWATICWRENVFCTESKGTNCERNSAHRCPVPSVSCWQHRIGINGTSMCSVPPGRQWLLRLNSASSAWILLLGQEEWWKH